MRRFLAALLLIMLLCGSALADDVCVVADIRSASVIETTDSYLCLTVPASPGQNVTASVSGDSGLVWQQSWQDVSGSFRTEDIYLKLKGSSTSYHVAVSIDQETIEFDVLRKIGRLTGNAACTAGYPLRSISGADTWQSATVISTRDGTTSVPVVTGSGSEIGSAQLTIDHGSLTVTVYVYDAATTVDTAEVLVGCDAQQASRLGRKDFQGVKGRLNTPIDVSGSEYIAVWTKLTVSYDPSDAVQGSITLSGQDALWQSMLNAQ